MKVSLESAVVCELRLKGSDLSFSQCIIIYRRPGVVYTLTELAAAPPATLVIDPVTPPRAVSVAVVASGVKEPTFSGMPGERLDLYITKCKYTYAGLGLEKEELAEVV